MLNDEIMTLEEVARYLKLKPQTVYKWAQENQIPGTKLGKEWRFRKRILDEWIDSSILLSKSGFDFLVQSSQAALQRQGLTRADIEALVRQAGQEPGPTA